MEYEFLDHPADVVVRAYGKNWEEVFRNLGIAVFASMLDVSKVERKEERKFEVDGEDLEHLLYNFLSKLLVYKDAEGLAFSDFDIKIRKNKLECKAYGEKISGKHEVHSDVKAVSWHMFEMGEADGKKYAQILIDI